MTGRLLRYIGFVVLATMLMAGVARAQSCSLSITNINFGNVDVLSGAPVNATGTASVSCLRSPFRSILGCLGIGDGSGGMISGIRQMRNATNAPLGFQLFQDPARTVPLGSVFRADLGSAAPVSFGPGFGNRTQNIPIYARIPANQQSTAPGVAQGDSQSGLVLILLPGGSSGQSDGQAAIDGLEDARAGRGRRRDEPPGGCGSFWCVDIVGDPVGCAKAHDGEFRAKAAGWRQAVAADRGAAFGGDGRLRGGTRPEP